MFLDFSRRKRIEKILSADIIDLDDLRKLTFRVGCLDSHSIRASVWKLLLNYIPADKSQWPTVLERERKTYAEFVHETVIKPNYSDENSNSDDHPLNPHPKSKWGKYFQENEILLQIDKDCRRIYPDLDFFQRTVPVRVEFSGDASSMASETLRQRVERTMLDAQNVSKNWKGVSLAQQSRNPKARSSLNLHNDAPSQNTEYHWEVVERILFVYAKLNPGQGYVQGMNEVIGPLYYVFYNDAQEQVYAEPDTFWCFTNLMSEIRDNFIKHLDDSACGIGSKMSKFLQTLRELDPPLWQKLNDQDIKPQYFAFRWFTILLTQEFSLPDTLRIWDSLFSDHKRFDFLTYVCCAMLVLKRDEILAGDFASNVKLIQNYSTNDVQLVLSKAVELAGLR